MEALYNEGELMQPHTDFHHGAYAKVASFEADDLAAEAALPLRLLQLRAQIASGAAAAAQSSISASEAAGAPDLAAARALAQLAAGDTAEALKAAEALVVSSADNASVQVLCGTVLAACGRHDEAVALLARHQGSLEAVALATQLHLQANRTDLALREVQAARKWAQDSLLVNLAESWVGLRLGGDRYQQAFYEFEDMPVAQAVAEIHLGRLPEAEAALAQVLEASDRKDVPALANSLVLNTLAGKDADDLTKSLQEAAPEHPLLVDLKEKSEAFDQAALRYSAKA